MTLRPRYWPLLLTLLVSLVFALEIWTFHNFFFFNPLEAGYPLVSIAQFCWFVALIAVITVPPVVILQAQNEGRVAQLLFGVAAIMWPASILFIRIAALISTGNTYMAYLIDYPIFLFTDLAVPVLYIWMWRCFVRTQNPSSENSKVKMHSGVT
jgi:hypothetical protein